jgi:2-polyprenyl-6-methoxyphenol hydroxylase-like FAD-dependent oxidoreductase
MKAIIVGGGIGGLTTALMLRARGIGCELFEQSETIRELGVGINTLPHAIRELAGLGLLDRLDEVAIRTGELFYQKKSALKLIPMTAGAASKAAGHSAQLATPCKLRANYLKPKET